MSYSKLQPQFKDADREYRDKLCSLSYGELFEKENYDGKYPDKLKKYEENPFYLIIDDERLVIDQIMKNFQYFRERQLVLLMLNKYFRKLVEDGEFPEGVKTGKLIEQFEKAFEKRFDILFKIRNFDHDKLKSIDKKNKKNKKNKQNKKHSK